jgi:hypothetical protein
MERGGARPWKLAIDVKPGRHRVAIAFVQFNTRDAFPIQFEERTVTVKSGESSSFKIFALEGNTRASIAYAAPAVDKVHEYLRRMEAHVQTRLDEMKLDLLVRGLDRTLSEVKRRPPSRRAIWVEIPEKYGGPRELDAAQIHLLADWLQFRYWDDLRNLSRLSVALPPDALAHGQRLEVIVENARSAIDEFRGIARALDVAEME